MKRTTLKELREKAKSQNITIRRCGGATYAVESEKYGKEIVNFRILKLIIETEMFKS